MIKRLDIVLNVNFFNEVINVGMVSRGRLELPTSGL